MFKSKVVGLVAILALPVSALAAPDCTAPAKPDLPKNGAILSAVELDSAANLVTGYSRASRNYQACLDEVISKPGEHSREEWRAALKAYNASAPGVETVWDTYQKLSDDWVTAHLVKKPASKK